MGSNDFVSLLDLGRITDHFHINISIINTFHISFYNAGFTCFFKHGTYIALVINDRADFGIMFSCFGDNSYQSVSGNYIHIYINAVFGSFIDVKNIEPVVSVAADNSRGNFWVIRIFFVQINQLAVVFQFVVFADENFVVITERIQLIF